MASAPVDDPYELLGVATTASADEIRQAYRALARKYHPDVNKEHGAEEHFKLLGQAYSVLSDAKRRALYDEFGAEALSIQFDPARARAESGRRPLPRDESAAGHRRAAPRGRGRERSGPRSADVVSELEIDLLTAITGGELRVTSPVGGAVLRAVVPPNVQPGHRIRFKGRGRASRAGGGGPGDLYLEVVVRPHPFYHRDGLDLVLELPLTVEEAWRGASVDIPTLAGWLRVPIPAGSRGGERLRLRGKGIYDGELAGDLYVHLCVRLPDRLEAAGRSLERLAGLYSDDVRQGLHL